MARRSLVVDGERWEVYPSGLTTVYPRDQFGLLFEHGTGTQRRIRVTRYAPVGSRSPVPAFQELTEHELQMLFRQSQPSWTAPEAAYA